MAPNKNKYLINNAQYISMWSQTQLLTDHANNMANSVTL